MVQIWALWNWSRRDSDIIIIQCHRIIVITWLKMEIYTNNLVLQVDRWRDNEQLSSVSLYFRILQMNSVNNKNHLWKLLTKNKNISLVRIIESWKYISIKDVYKKNKKNILCSTLTYLYSIYRWIDWSEINLCYLYNFKSTTYMRECCFSS